METLLSAIILNSLNMTLAALLLMLVLRAFKRVQSPKIRYYSWLIVLAGFLIPFRFSFGKALVRIPRAVSSTAPALSGSGVYKVVPASSGTSFSSLMLVIEWIYLLGVIVTLTMSFVRFFRWKKTVLRLSHSLPEYDAFIGPVAEEMGIPSVELRLSDAVSSPMMIGLFSPTILLPNRKYEYHELRLILKHELVHFLHKDLWIKLLLIFCRSLHWFNPFMILFGRTVEQECEYYCDMAVMEDEPEKMRKVYCQSILNTLADQVQRREISSRPVLATSFYSPKTGLKHRFSMVLTGKKRLIVGSIILSLLLTAVSGFAVSGKAEEDDADSSKFYVSSARHEEEWNEESEEQDSAFWVEVTESVENVYQTSENDIQETTFIEYADPEPSVSESVLWTGEMETENETGVYETFVSEQYEIRPSNG